MKIKGQYNNRHGKFLLSVLILLVILCLSQPVFGEVNLLGSWVTGTSHTKESGSDRVLIFIAHEESASGTPILTSVTYGGQSMTKIIERSAGGTGSGYDNYVAAFILDEAGVAAATNDTFSPTWSASTSSVSYSSVFLENVEQMDLVGASDSAGSVSSPPNPITTGPLTTEDGDMVILGSTCGNNGTYTLNNGFIEGTDQSVGSNGHAGVTGYKAATGASETPSATFDDTANRLAIIGFVVQGTIPDPNKASDPNPARNATNIAVTTNLSWTAGVGATSHDVYLGTNPTAHSNPKTTVYTNSYDPPSDLLYGTTYYWVVDSNASGVITPGDDWNFSTVVNKATNPNPSNGELNVSLTTNLSWTDSVSASSYDVYFGTNPVTHSNPKTTVYTNSYNPPGDLEEGTTYYWVVDTNDNGTIYTGDDWYFRSFQPADRVLGNMILLNDNGGWCWYQDEKIAYDPVGGNVLMSTAAQATGFGGIGSTRHNDMDTTTFNITTGQRTRVVAKEGFGGDDHNMGAFWIRPDGRYLHIYCSHYNDPQVSYLRLSDYPNDGSSWGTEYTYNWETISGLTDTLSSSYTNVVYLSGEGTGNGRLYNIIRVFERTPCISYSDDWGVTWNYMGRLNGITGTTTYSNFYHKFKGNGVDRIDFIGTEQHPRNYNNSVFHGYIKGGKSYNSYGVEIDTINDQDAPSVQAFTPVFIADLNQTATSYHTGWTNEMELTSDGYPVCLYQTRYGTEPWGDGSGQANIGAADHRFFYARFDGTSWTSTELAKMGTGLHLPEQDYIGMGCIHPDDANIVYIATQFDPRDDVEYEYREIFKGVTSDNGLTWDWTQITFNSTINNTRPAIPQWDANNTAVVWTRGNWIQDHYEQYDLVVVGIIDQKDVTLGQTTYIDASESNTTEADDTAFTPTGPSNSAGAADSQWHEYTGYGNGGSCYTAGDSGTENAPAIKTTITGLADGTYDVFAYFWCDPAQDWGVRGGFTESDMLCFNKQSSQTAEESDFSGSVEVMNGTYLLYRVYIGRKTISGGSSAIVYVDNYDSSYSGNVPTRTTYDGVGIAPVVTGPVYNPGDLDHNGKVDMFDIAELGNGWLTIYDINNLADIAANWLYGT